MRSYTVKKNHIGYRLERTFGIDTRDPDTFINGFRRKLNMKNNYLCFSGTKLFFLLANYQLEFKMMVAKWCFHKLH